MAGVRHDGPARETLEPSSLVHTCRSSDGLQSDNGVWLLVQTMRGREKETPCHKQDEGRSICGCSYAVPFPTSGTEWLRTLSVTGGE